MPRCSCFSWVRRREALRIDAAACSVTLTPQAIEEELQGAAERCRKDVLRALALMKHRTPALGASSTRHTLHPGLLPYSQLASPKRDTTVAIVGPRGSGKSTIAGWMNWGTSPPASDGAAAREGSITAAAAIVETPAGITRVTGWDCAGDFTRVADLIVPLIRAATCVVVVLGFDDPGAAEWLETAAAVLPPATRVVVAVSRVDKPKAFNAGAVDSWCRRQGADRVFCCGASGDGIADLGAAIVRVCQPPRRNG